MLARVALAMVVAALLRPPHVPSDSMIATSQQAAATQTAPRADSDRKPFQPGIAIDWQQPALYLDAVVVNRRAALEFIASFAGKEHESILRLQASPEHLFLAIGLIGIEPGTPPGWNRETQQFSPPSGRLVDAMLEWTNEHGALTTAPAFDWVREFEFARVAFDRPFVFSGVPPERERGLAAELAGSGLALVNKSGSLLCLSRDLSDANASLWAVAATERIPADRTAVTVVLRPAKSRPVEVEIDALGQAYVTPVLSNGARGERTWLQSADVIEMIRLNRMLDESYVQRITLRGTLRSDERAWDERLRRHLPEGSFDFAGRD